MTAGSVCALAGLWILLLGCSAIAQSTLARLSGSVVDGERSPVAGAMVVAHDTQRNVVREVITDAQGRYVFTALDPATYRVAARHPAVGTAVEPL